jgi:hypothetical protein
MQLSSDCYQKVGMSNNLKTIKSKSTKALKLCNTRSWTEITEENEQQNCTITGSANVNNKIHPLNIIVSVTEGNLTQNSIGKLFKNCNEHLLGARDEFHTKSTPKLSTVPGLFSSNPVFKVSVQQE